MANKLKYINDIEQGLVIESWHVSQSVEAFSSTNQQAYDISVSGSFNVTGSVSFEPNNINNQVRNYVLSFDDTTGRVLKWKQVVSRIMIMKFIELVQIILILFLKNLGQT